VTSITYKNKEGKVIATCLAYSSDEDLSQLSDIGNQITAPTPFTVKTTVTTNTSDSGGFMSSSRLSLAQPSPVNINYNFNCQAFNTCLSSGSNCSYNVQFRIINLDNPERSLSQILLHLLRPSIAAVQDNCLCIRIGVHSRPGHYLPSQVLAVVLM
jgi:hypothetical protein